MNKQSYMFITSFVLVLSLWYFLLLAPYKTEKDNLEQKIAENTSQLQDYEQTINILPKFISERDKLKQRKKYINSKLYTKEEVINLFSHLKKTASKQDLIVTEITPPIEELLRLNSIIPDSTKPQFLNIGVSVSGSYKDFALFVKQIENESYFRGINVCSIFGSKSINKKLDLHIGFKALLGRIGDKS